VRQACDDVGTFVNGEFIRGKLWPGGFAVRELLYRVSTPDERCPSHPHICHRAKFERNRTICAEL